MADQNKQEDAPKVEDVHPFRKAQYATGPDGVERLVKAPGMEVDIEAIMPVGIVNAPQQWDDRAGEFVEGPLDEDPAVREAANAMQSHHVAGTDERGGQTVDIAGRRVERDAVSPSASVPRGDTRKAVKKTTTPAREGKPEAEGK